MLEGDVPVWFPDIKGGILERLIRHQPARAAGGRARLPLLLRTRRAGAAARARRHEPHGRDRERARGQPRPAAELGAHAGRAQAPRRRVRRSAARPAPARGDRALPRPPPPRRARGGDARRGSRAASEAGSRRSASRRRAAGAGCRRGRLPELLAAHAALSQPVADPLGRPRYVVLLARGLRAHPRRGLGRAARRRLRAPLRHGREPRLVPQPRPDRRAARRRPAGGHVLIDYSGGTGILLDRLRLRIFDRQVGMVIVDSSPKFLRVALDRFRHDERVAFRRLHYLRDERRLEYVDEALGDELSRRRRPRLDERDPPLRRPRRHAARVGARAQARAAESGSTPATCATRAPARTSGSSTRPSTSCTRSRRGSSAPTRAGRRTASARRRGAACAPTSRGATASSSRRARSTTTSTRFAARRLHDRRRHRADDRGGRRGVVRVPGRVRRRRARLGRAARRRSTARRRRGGGGRPARAAARVARHDLRRTADLPLLLDLHHRDAP